MEHSLKAEYVSYVPKIIYNNNDFAGDAPSGIEDNSRPHIASGDGINYSMGVNLTIRLNGLFRSVWPPGVGMRGPIRTPCLLSVLSAISGCGVTHFPKAISALIAFRRSKRA